MSVKIRLARRGRKRNPFYHIIIADARAPRDGKFIENIGSYNPMTVPATIEVDRDKAYEWLQKGAQPTNTVKAILKFKGVYYRKHLMRGVAKGALSEEKAMEMYQEWIDSKEAKVAARKEETKKKKEEFWKMVSGEIKPSKKKAEDTAAEAFREDGGDAQAEAPSEDAPAEVEAPKAEEKAAEPAKKEAPKAEEKAKEAPKAEPAKEEAPKAEEKAPEAPKKEPAKEEAPKVEEKKAAPVKEEAPAKEAAAPVVAAAAVAAATTDGAKADDLTKIEGIGPAISKVLVAGGIVSFSDLAAKPADEVKAILTEAGGRFSMHNPATWGQQADLAAKGEWDTLKELQDKLDGGKPLEDSPAE